MPSPSACSRANLDAPVDGPTARPPALLPAHGMAFVLVRFVKHLQALRRESLGQLLCDEIGGPHVARLGEGGPPVNGWNLACNTINS